ncbi:hypothetical protein [Polyangium jinanense]|uniref:Uncharacterized protein n=1 Tax=Polyangium jinanense TaxID=2829994 RepID=A0A9X3X4J9_9BACT|nr:hypothetical protein [Polyangium jinanense]MDC3983594.1 hypothetical protein [Polyangium jinanense]
MSGDGGTPGGGASSAVTTYCVPTLKITKVACTAGHVLPNLFVLFRKTPPKPGDPTIGSKIAAMWTSEETPAGPVPPYVLGMTDATGYLGPPIDHASPTCFDQVPDAYKLQQGQSYDVYLIQHPSLDLALRIEAELNAGSKAFGEPRALTVRADAPTLEVPEESKGLLPAGADLYEGWVLFRDMPFAACEPVKKQVQRLQAHLGALRYMVGTSNFPYLPDAGTDADKSGGVNDGIFDVRTMNAVYRYQQDARSRAFQVNGGGASGPHAAYVDYGANFAPKVDRGALSAMQAELKALKKQKALTEDQKKQKITLDGKIKAEQADVKTATNIANAWAYLDGSEIAAPADKPDAADGVVTAATGKALKTWLLQGLRKPGAILVSMMDPRGWLNWMRPEAAQSLHGWSELVKALGFEHGICVNHTFRSAQVDIGKAGYGRSARSIHKTGLAMDLGIASGFVDTVSGWPVAYTREVVDGRVKWRLHGSAKQSLPGVADAAAHAAPLVERLVALRDEQSKTPIAAAMLLPAIEKLLAEIQANPAGFFAKYYRASIERWMYDAWHPEGGIKGATMTASEFFAEHEPGKAAEAGDHGAYLDITAVGELLHLGRISSFKSGWGQATKTVKATELVTLADALDKAKTSKTDDDVVTVSRGKSTKLKSTVPALDADFMRRWAGTLKDAKKEIAKSVKTNTPQLTVTLSWSAAKIEDAKKVAAKLREYGDKPFYVVVSDESQPPVQSGEAWAKYIEERPQALEQQAPANQNVKQNTGATVPSAKPKASSWTVTLNPIFEIGYAAPADSTSVPASVLIMPGDAITVPAPGQPIGMEWWHFQRSDLLADEKSRKLWGSFLLEVGWTRECLLENTGPALYHRAGVGYPESELSEKAY